MNKNNLFVLSVLLLLTTGLFAQTRPFTPRYSNNSVRGNIKFVSNNIITSSGGGTTQAPPAGTATNNSSRGINLDVDAVISTTNIFPVGSVWKYWDQGTTPTSWESSAFDDSGWPSGVGEFGYGDGDEATIVSYGPSISNKYTTTYFRKQVTIADASLYNYFALDIEYDDGAVIYVNGVEVARANMPNGVVGFSTFASSAATENVYVPFTIPASYFVSGLNTIAVEIHQNNLTSTDLSFDMRLNAVVDPTFNSTSADLSLQSCSEVLWAGLYWGATLSSTNTSWRVGYNNVLLKVPGSANYATVTSTQTELHEAGAGSTHNGYTCFADVTSLINTTSADGTYTTANVVTPVATGLNNQSAGWTLVIVYRNPAEIPRNLVVFDGFEIVGAGSQKDIALGGFLTPITGPVSCELGAVVYDGDRNSVDGWFFKQDSVAGVGTYTDLSNAGTRGNNDSWNSTISYLGSVVTTRTPAHQNTLGYDANIIQLTNPSNSVLGNNRTSARIRLSSPSGGENYYLHVVTSSIAVANPSFALTKSSVDLNGGSWAPGEALQYVLENRNRGTDTSINSTIIDTLPANVNYSPGSLIINGVAKTDAAGDDEAEYDPIGRRVIFRVGIGANAATGGTIYPNQEDIVSFVVTATQTCEILACNNVARNQAVIYYTGKNSNSNLVDHSGILSAGCFVEAPLLNTITGSCTLIPDVTVVNQCPILSYLIDASPYVGYRIYRAMPFIPVNEYDPAIPVTSAGTYYAFWSSGSGCNDTVRISVLIQPCPDIDDDDDGIPDLIESNGADAFGDDDSDGIPNFTDVNYPGFVDTDGDGVNDNFDADLDGIPNQFDRDSDNDGIPDVVEASGVDTDGDGRIDNFADVDNDGLSDNVDANLSGEAGSGSGLGASDLDTDGVPNHLDLDSDNDGIPDVLEAGGTDANNDGRIDNYSDADADGFSDNVDGDPNNDGVSENTSSSLLRTGADSDADGRANSYPFRNFDGDSRANPYDLDSDNDGITDTREGGFTDANSDGMADGATGTDGWNDAIDAAASLNLRNSDGDTNPDYLDIDSDNDGVPDNIEGPSTSGYRFPIGLDTDGDGIDDQYDTINGFGGNGNTPNDQDGDSIPDYIDQDTDGDGLNDVIEANDFNSNCLPDDTITLTGTDTDGDGLDDRFDNDNTSSRGTSFYMGALGSMTGDPSPGSLTMVNRCNTESSERDWRYQPYLLSVNFIGFTGTRAENVAKLNWVASCDELISRFEVERSYDGVNFVMIGTIAGGNLRPVNAAYTYSDGNLNVSASNVYYRIKAVSASNKWKRSRQIMLNSLVDTELGVFPNPATDHVQVQIRSSVDQVIQVRVVDALGKAVLVQNQRVHPGLNTFALKDVTRLAGGIYYIQINTDNHPIIRKLVLKR